MTKRVGFNLSHGSHKRNKVECPAKVNIGHSSNLTTRELKLFDAIFNLVTKEKEVNCSNLPSKDGSSLFMEFDIEKESLILLLQTPGIVMKFLVHPVYTIGALERPAAHPLISFSQNFVDSENWRLTKSALSEMFEGVSNNAEDPDYLYAFSRRGDFIHLRIYKVLSFPNSSAHQKGFKLSGLLEHICLLQVSFPPKGMIQAKVSQTIDLVAGSVYVGTQSNFNLLHAATFKRSNICFALDDPIDLSSWYGFGTCLSDFKERNQVMLSGRLIGSTPPNADFVNDRYKEIIWSILIKMFSFHQNGLCFYELKETDVCLRGTNVQFSWQIDVLGYDVAPARMNHRNIRDIILAMFRGVALPPDLAALLDLLSCDHLTPGEYLCNHSSLMSDINRGHMVTDIHFEFSSSLTFKHKLFVAEPLLHYLHKWRQAFQSNDLLKGVLEHKFDESVRPSEPVLGLVPAVELPRSDVQTIDGEPMEDQAMVRQPVSDPVSAVELPSGGIRVTDPNYVKSNDAEPMKDLAMVREITKLVATLSNCRMHILDHLIKQHKDSGDKRPMTQLQLHESMRIITSTVPDVLHVLQNELRNIFGDTWFAKYFTNQ